MEKVISVLQFILKIATNISDLIFKLPVWVIKLIPGGKKLLESFEGYRTVAANFSVGVIAFMEGKDWLEIGDSVCAFVNMVLGIFKLNYVCDPSWFPQLALILTAMMNLSLRKQTASELPKTLK